MGDKTLGKADTPSKQGKQEGKADAPSNKGNKKGYNGRQGENKTLGKADAPSNTKADTLGKH